MNNNFLYKLQNSNSRVSYVPLSNKNTIKKINIFINKIINKKLNNRKKNDLIKLNINDLNKIEKKLKKDYQEKLKSILRNDIYKIIKKIYNINKIDFRVGVQIKYKWTLKDIKKRNRIFFTKSGTWRESRTKPNICFPTRPHQDLSNNGFRSSSVLIIYIPLTPSFNESSIMQIAPFKKKHGLYKMKNKYGYPNEVDNKIVKKLKWEIPKFLKPGNIFLMDSLTMHNSSNFSEVPRIALNIKIQPVNLNYIFNAYKIKKEKNFNLNKLISDLTSLTKKNNGFNFELAVAHYLNGNKKLSLNSIKKLCLQKFNSNEIKKILLGGIIRKEIGKIKNTSLTKLFKKNISVEKKSCAESILNTIN